MTARGVGCAERVLSQGFLMANGHDSAVLLGELRRVIGMLADGPGDREERAVL